MILKVGEWIFFVAALCSDHKPRLSKSDTPQQCACAKYTCELRPFIFCGIYDDATGWIGVLATAMLLRRRIPLTQLLVAAVLGVASGIYIFKPIFKPPPDTTSEAPVTSVSKNWTQLEKNRDKKLSYNGAWITQWFVINDTEKSELKSDTLTKKETSDNSGI